MNPRHHARSPSYGRALHAHGRPARPQGLHKRVHSYHHAPSPGQTSNSSCKSGSGSRRPVVTTEIVSQDEEDDTGMASFPQFCATCEKQIVTPNNSILYCSEKCRKKDVSQLGPRHPLQSPSVIPTASSYFDLPPADIVPQRSPTDPRPVSLTFSELTISDDESSPDESSGHPNGDHEAMHYLSQFHSQSYNGMSWSSRRHMTNRSSTDSGTPSLINTPSSSVGTAASMKSHRTLPLRHDPLAPHGPTKSIDLVTPIYPTAEPASPTNLMKNSSHKSNASTLTSFNTAEAEDVSFPKVAPSRKRGTVVGKVQA